MEISAEKMPLNSDDLNSRYKKVVEETKKNLGKLCENLGSGERNFVERQLMKGMEKDYQNRVKLNDEKTVYSTKRVLNMFETNLSTPSYAAIKDSFEDLTTTYVLPFQQNFETFTKKFMTEFNGTNQKYQIFAEHMPSVVMKYFEKIINVCKKIAEADHDNMKMMLETARDGEKNLRDTISEYEK